MNANLIITKTSGQKKTIPITKPITTLGRGAECDLRIPIDSCSRVHCHVSLQGNSLSVKDLGSSNGTFVNNQRVEETVLSAGDRLTIGPVVITIQIDGVPADSAEAGYDAGEELIPSQSGSSLDDLSAAAGGETLAEDPISALEALADMKEEEE